MRKSCFKHLAIHLRGNGMQLLWGDFAGKPVHQFTPGPEAILFSAAVFSQAGHRALKGMAVGVGNCG